MASKKDNIRDGLKGAIRDSGDAASAGDTFLAVDLVSSGDLDGAGVEGTLIVGTSAVELKVGGSVLTDRKTAGLDNSSGVTIYWGYTNAVTTTTGRRIFNGQNDAEWCLSDGAHVWLIAATPANTVRISESV